MFLPDLQARLRGISLRQKESGMRKVAVCVS